MGQYGKPSEFHTAEVSILWRQRTHDSACITGSHGTDDVVDASTETVDANSVALYLGYDVWGLDASKVDVVELIVSPL